MHKTAHRPQQITIDTVRPNALPMVSILVQKVNLDESNQVTAIFGNTNRVHRAATAVMTETVEFTDPVTGLSGSISIAALQGVLTRLSSRWISEDLGHDIDPATGWTTE